MNWSHLQSIIWLRWRLSVNRWKRGGTLNAIVMVVLAVLGLSAAASSFFIALLVGVFAMSEVSPDSLMLILDGICVAFLMAMMIGLVTDVQRSESLSLENLLHLPISVSGTFLLNYLSSLLSLSVILFVPTMVGLSMAMAIVHGPRMLVMLPLMFGFLLMVTGVAYQFRGWLATLMVNKRRRRTIVALVTVVFIALVQIPNIVNLAILQPRRALAEKQQREELSQIRDALKAREIDPQQYETQVTEVTKRHDEEEKIRLRSVFQPFIVNAVVVNQVLPIGWLPYGARAAAQGHILAGILGSLGAALIGAASLWRAYGTALRYYTGGYQSGRKGKRKSAAPVRVEPSTGGDRFLERTLGPISEQATAVALTNFRSLTRATEAKMMLLTPIILLVIFGSMTFSRSGQDVAEAVRPLMGFGAISLTMFGFAQLMQNLFGFDRDGFRSYVLTPAPRRDILLGKNLSVAPMALGMCLIGVVALQILIPMRATHFLATLVQMLSVYLIFCMVGNLISIVLPFAIRPGSMKAAKSPTIGIVIQAIVVMMLYPLTLGPLLLPLGIEVLLDRAGWGVGIPVYLILVTAELAIIGFVYNYVLDAEGQMLRRREQSILESVTVRGD